MNAHTRRRILISIHPLLDTRKPNDSPAFPEGIEILGLHEHVQRGPSIPQGKPIPWDQTGVSGYPSVVHHPTALGTMYIQ